MKQEKWRSKYFWLGITGAAVTFLISVGAIDVGQGESINGVVSAISTLLAAFGVWNDAGNREEW